MDSPPSFLSSREVISTKPPFFHLVAQMNSYTKILEETRSMVSGYMSGLDPSHDMYHVDRVTNLGMCFICSTGCLLIVLIWLLRNYGFVLFYSSLHRSRFS